MSVLLFSVVIFSVVLFNISGLAIKKIKTKLTNSSIAAVDRDSVNGITTRYGLDGPGIEFQRERDFSLPSKPVLGSIQPPV